MVARVGCVLVIDGRSLILTTSSSSNHFAAAGDDMLGGGFGESTEIHTALDIARSESSPSIFEALYSFPRRQTGFSRRWTGMDQICREDCSPCHRVRRPYHPIPALANTLYASIDHDICVRPAFLPLGYPFSPGLRTNKCQRHAFMHARVITSPPKRDYSSS